MTDAKPMRVVICLQRGQRAVAMALTLVSAGVALSCTRRVDTSPADSTVMAPSDTVRGTVELTGSLPLAQLILRWGNGPGDGVALSGPAAEMLAGLTGLEVMVRGHWGDDVPTASPAGLRGFVAEDFVVRAGDGVEAHDGVVALRDGIWVLVTSGGASLPTPFLPDALRHQEGVRVYLLGPLNAPPAGYGVVRTK